MRPKPPTTTTTSNPTTKPVKIKKQAKVQHKKMKEKKKDCSVSRPPVDTSIHSFLDLMETFEIETPELKEFLTEECKLIYECKICKSLFRSMVNFLTHKRSYCFPRFKDMNHNGEFEEQNLVLGSCSNTLSTTTTTRKDIIELLDNITNIKSDCNVNSPVVMRDIEQTSQGLLNSSNHEGTHPTLERSATLEPDERVIGSEPQESVNCPLCDSHYETHNDLRSHALEEHPELKEYFICPICKQYFAHCWSVYRHMCKDHGKTSEQVRKLRPCIQKKFVNPDDANRQKRNANEDDMLEKDRTDYIKKINHGLFVEDQDELKLDCLTNGHNENISFSSIDLTQTEDHDIEMNNDENEVIQIHSDSYHGKTSEQVRKLMPCIQKKFVNPDDANRQKKNANEDDMLEKEELTKHEFDGKVAMTVQLPTIGEQPLNYGRPQSIQSDVAPPIKILVRKDYIKKINPLKHLNFQTRQIMTEADSVYPQNSTVQKSRLENDIHKFHNVLLKSCIPTFSFIDLTSDEIDEDPINEEKTETPNEREDINGLFVEHQDELKLDCLTNGHNENISFSSIDLTQTEDHDIEMNNDENEVIQIHSDSWDSDDEQNLMKN